MLAFQERVLLSRIKNPCKSLAWGVIVWRYAGDEPVVVFAHATIIHPKPKEESMLIIAIDLGKFNSVACLYSLGRATESGSDRSNYSYRCAKAKPNKNTAEENNAKNY